MAFVHCNGFLKSNFYKNRNVWFYIRDGLQNQMHLSMVHLLENQKTCVPFAFVLRLLATIRLPVPVSFSQVTFETTKIQNQP